MQLLMFAPAAIGIGMLISALVTGRALTPLRGTLPMIVRRAEQPGLYWSSIALTMLFTAVALWIALSRP